MEKVNKISTEEIKQLSYLLQKLQKNLWEERYERIINRTTGTFYKYYDAEEEVDTIAEDIEKYLKGDFEYLDKEYENAEEANRKAFEKEKRMEELVEKMRYIIDYFK